MAIERLSLETLLLLPLFLFSPSDLYFDSRFHILEHVFLLLLLTCTPFIFLTKFSPQFEIRSINQLLEFFLAQWYRFVLIGAVLGCLVCLKEMIGVGNTNIGVKFALVVGGLLTPLIVSLVRLGPILK